MEGSVPGHGRLKDLFWIRDRSFIDRGVMG